MKTSSALVAMVPPGTLLTLQTQSEPVEPVHIRRSFEFSLPLSFSAAAPLFGPDGERAWAGDEWEPQFLYPRPGKDVEGVVFLIQRGQHSSIWVNTLFDLASGRFQYVYFVADVMATVVDVRLEMADAEKTIVHVAYTRTALSVEANDQVIAMGEHDRTAGARWEQSIRASLANKH